MSGGSIVVTSPLDHPPQEYSYHTCPWDCTLSPGQRNITHPPQANTPGDISLKPNIRSPGVCCLVSYTVVYYWGFPDLHFDGPSFESRTTLAAHHHITSNPNSPRSRQKPHITIDRRWRNRSTTDFFPLHWNGPVKRLTYMWNCGLHVRTNFSLPHTPSRSQHPRTYVACPHDADTQNRPPDFWPSSLSTVNSHPFIANSVSLARCRPWKNDARLARGYGQPAHCYTNSLIPPDTTRRRPNKTRWARTQVQSPPSSQNGDSYPPRSSGDGNPPGWERSAQTGDTIRG